jgi:FtsH-binding integral membrane protein
MSYSMGYPAVAHAPAAERAAFIQRTYGHLAGAILAFIALETVLLNIPGIEKFIIPMVGGRVSWLLVLGAFMAIGWVANAWAQSDTSRGLQYLGLGLYVVAEAIIFLPLLYIARLLTNDPYLIPTAGVVTLAVFGGLTLAVFITGRDFSFLRTALSIGGFLALGIIVASAFMGFSLGMFFCYGMVALMSGYILYYTSNIMYHYRTDQHVAAALALFASVATLFWYILQIFMSERR